MRCSRLTQALLLSLALHLGLGLRLFLATPPESAPAPEVRHAPLWLEVVERTPPARAEPPRPVSPAPQQAAPPRPPRAASRPPRPSAAPVLPSPGPPAPEEAPPDEAPPDAPRAVRLFPGPGLPVGPPMTGGTPGGTTGRTVRAGEGPSPEQLLAEERERVHGRVQGFLEDGLATLRVENGLVDSFFGEMDKALEKGLSGAPLFAYQGVLEHFLKATPERAQGLREMLASAERYGATGSPYSLGDSSGRARPSAVDMLEAYNRRAGALHATLELEQSPRGLVLSVKLLENSGNPLFDAYVLERVPASLSALGPAPEHFAARAKGPVRSVWAVEGHVSFSRTLKASKLGELDAADAAYFAALMPLGLLSGNFEETRGEVVVPDFRHPRFDIRTRLLRVY